MIKKCNTYVLLVYPDYNRCFYMHASASNIQLGVVIIHIGNPIQFYSYKLSDTHKVI